MELRHLRYFVGVAEELHFARAARRLGISQPPLSQQIHALEEELGTRLFDRTSRSVQLTGAGKAFLEAARATLAEADRAVQVARRAARGEIGELSVGFNASAPFVPRIARAIFDFRERYPDVQLMLNELSSPAHPARLLDRTLDIAFVRSAREPVLPPGIAAIPIVRERMFVAMRPDHRLSMRNQLYLTDLAHEPMLVYRQGAGVNFTEEFLHILAHAGVEPVIAQNVGEVSTLFGLAAAGVGVAILAESLCALQSARLAYRPIADDAALTSIWLLHLEGPGMSLPCRNFLSFVEAEGGAPGLGPR